MTGIKLEVGKHYKTRDGRKVLLESVCDDGIRCVILVGSTLHKVWNDHIIAECNDDTEVGTLAEIGAHVGDVVEYVSPRTGGAIMHRISAFSCNGDKLKFINDKGAILNCVDPHWRIITRAKPQGPVITETVKRIAPGVYGKVEITEVGNVWMQPTMSRAELIAARDVFNQLIEAMPIAVS